jgi:hypothetical protein
MKILIAFLILIGACSLKAQTIIKGKILENSGAPLVGATVMIEGTYQGVSSQTDGSYKLIIKGNGTRNLVFSFMGYEEKKVPVSLNADTIKLEVKLTEKISEMRAVVLTAGAFGAAESKKAVIFSPVDILTTPTSVGDMYGALHTLPGSSVVGEDGGIYVRGGEASETKTFVDGLLVQRPLGSHQPDMPARGRFSPSLFSGTTFSTGGYSAEYGQALSSALLLNSNGVAEKSLTGLSFFPFGFGFSQTMANDTQSLAVSGDYYNMDVFYRLFHQNVDWIKRPQSGSANVMYRYKTKSNGIFKAMVNATKSSSELRMSDSDYLGLIDQVGLNSNDIYTNLSYQSDIQKAWQIKTGLSLTRDREYIDFNDKTVNTYRNGMQAKVTIIRSFDEKARIRFGVDHSLDQYQFRYVSPQDNVSFYPEYTSNLMASFAEADYRVSNSVALRAGGRYEYSALLNEGSFSPRYSIAFKTGENSQFSYAGGLFAELPLEEALRVNHSLKLEKAFHHILNYQYIANNRTFRVELYHKQYRNLICYDSINSPVPQSFRSSGYGYARGIDFYWRDKSFTNTDYWVSYSYLDTRRLYHDFPESATPRFFPKHSASAVYKYFINVISSQVALSYTIASGRPYNNPNISGFMNSHTPSYQDLSASISYVLQKKKVLTIVHASVNNILGRSNVYGYHYSKYPADNGLYIPSAIIPASKRFYLLAVFLSFENDKKN